MFVFLVQLSKSQKLWGKHLGRELFPVENLADAESDENNLLWLGYYGDGVKAFNGNKIVEEIDVNDSLPGNFVVDLFCKNDSVFIVQDKHFSVWKNGMITNFKIPELKNSEELAAFYIDAQNRKWLTTDGGKIILYNAGFKNYQLFDFDTVNNSHYMFHIQSDKQGNTWFATDLGLVLKYENGEFININKKYHINFLTHNDFFPTDSCMYIADEAGFYKILPDTALCLINPATIDKSSGVHNIRNIVSYQNKTIVYSMFGISEVKIKNNSVEFLRTYTKYDNSVYFGFNRMFVDKNNILWIVTFKNGLYQIFDFDAKVYTPHDFIKNKDYLYDNIINIEKGTGNTILINMVGFFSIFNTQTDSFRLVIPSMEEGSDITSVFPLDSNYTRFWQATETSGMEYVDIKKGIYESYCQCGSSNSMPTINAAIMLSPDSFFVFQSTAIGVFYDKKFKFLKIKHNNTADLVDSYRDSSVYKDLQFYNIERHNGKIYIASTEGVYIWDGNKMSYINHPEIKNTSIDQIVFDQNDNLWLYTFSGELLRYNEKNKEVADFTHLINQGIKGKSMYLTLEENNLWLDLYQKIVLDNASNPVKTNVYLSAPINNYYEQLNAAPIFTDGWIYISTGTQMIKFPESILQENTSTPSIEVLSIYNLSDSTYITEKNAFEYDKNTVKIKFSVNDFLVAEKNRQTEYTLVLDGDTMPWTSIPGENSLLFANLSPGNYNVLIRSKYIDGNHFNTIQAGMFSIYPPWYNTWWFYSFSVLAVAGLMYWYFYQKNKRMHLALETEKQIATLQHKAMQAQMNPHFIFNVLNTVQYHVLENDTKQTLEVLSKFSKLIRATFDLVGKEEISLHQEIKYLENYIEVEALRMDNAFDYTISTDENLNLFDIKLPPLLIQPFIENVFKHAFEKPFHKVARLVISFAKEGDYLIIKIQDNGKGTDTLSGKQTRAESGTSLTGKRYEVLNKQLKKQVYSWEAFSGNEGTTIIIKIAI